MRVEQKFDCFVICFALSQTVVERTGELIDAVGSPVDCNLEVALPPATLFEKLFKLSFKLLFHLVSHICELAHKIRIGLALSFNQGLSTIELVLNILSLVRKRFLGFVQLFSELIFHATQSRLDVLFETNLASCNSVFSRLQRFISYLYCLVLLT